MSFLALATRYDALNTALFWSAGGSRGVRQRLVNALDIESGQRHLDLGCGTGQTTELLLIAGAEVVGVDALDGMLDGARGRAPEATLVHGDVFEADVGDGYDRVVLSFVLHNFDAVNRVRLLRRAAAALAPSGRIGILDWALPSGRRRAGSWRRLLAAIEPSRSVADVLDGALETEATDVGLHIVRHELLAGGRSQLLVLADGDTA